MSIETQRDAIRLSTPPSGADDDFYPDSDGRPVGETPVHYRNASHLREMLEAKFSGEPQVYVAVNMFVYYAQGDRWKHLSPDVFVVRGVQKDKPRRKYLLWEEGKGPDLVIELTSASTLEEDVDKKWLYREVLGVREYVMFDPYAEYLHPPLQGFLLQQGHDVPMPIVAGRLVSEVLGLHFEADGDSLRLHDPAAGRWLRTPPEEREFAAETSARLDETAARLDQATVARDELAAEREDLAAERDRALADKARLEAELAELRRRLGG